MKKNIYTVSYNDLSNLHKKNFSHTVVDLGVWFQLFVQIKYTRQCVAAQYDTRRAPQGHSIIDTCGPKDRATLQYLHILNMYLKLYVLSKRNMYRVIK